jgi:hypothetical protein
MAGPDTQHPLVHIGLHKTGSSFLQRHLFGRTDRGFFPVVAARDRADARTAKRSAQSFGEYFYHDPEGAVATPLSFDADYAAARLGEVDWSQPGVPVISSERLSGNPHAGGFDSADIAERLARLLPRAKILVVIREQVATILSNYYEYLECGGTGRLQAYLDCAYDGLQPGFSFSFFEYHRLIERYLQLFGPGQVLVLPYEMFRDSPAEFVQRIGSFSGARIPVEELDFSIVVNPSMPPVVGDRTRLLNLLTERNSLNGRSPFYLPGSAAVMKRLRRWLGRLVPESAARRRLESHRDLIRRLAGERYHDSNALTSSLIGIDLRTYGYPWRASPAARAAAG